MLAAAVPDPAGAQDAAGGGQYDWPSHNLDLYGSRYAAIDQIDTTNAGRLWTSDFGPDSISKRVIRPGGLVIAADARTAEIRWVFNTIPQRPGDEGYDVARPTWGDGLRAGGGVWTVPAVDPELGLVYVNAGKAEAVRVVTVRAAHPGAVHPALRERPPYVDFSADLPVRVVQTIAQRARLERLGAERVRQLEVGMLPVRTLRIDEEAALARKEPGRHAEVGERRIAEVAEDRLRRGRLHGQVVVGTRPGLMLRLVALGAGGFIDIGDPGSA